MLTKSELNTELREFMTGFAAAIGRLYGGERAGPLLVQVGKNIAEGEASLEDTPLWTAVNDMYDYGVLGQKKGRLGSPDSLDGAYADAELFLRGLDSLALYFEEDEVPMPRKSIRVVRTAVARHLLDGGSRWTDYEDGQYGALSLAEIALLADMDERSVRNAANPKLATALVTTNVGKRTYVEIEDARRWLKGRKGFVPTEVETNLESQPPAEPVAIELSSKLVAQLTQTAALRGITIEELIALGVNTTGDAS